MKRLFTCLITFSCFLTGSAQLIKFEKVFGAWSYEKGMSCVQTWDSGYVVCGSSSSYGNGTSGLYLLKIDKLGNFVWHQTIGESNVEAGMSVVEAADSGIVAVGYTNSEGAGGYDVWLVKTDLNGNVLWKKTYGGPDWDFGNWIANTADGGYIVTGSTQSYGAGNKDIYLIRLNANGDSLWTRTYGGADEDEGAEIFEHPSGDFYLCGKTKSFGSGGNDIISMKLNASGDSTGGTGWHRIFGGNLDDEGTTVALNFQNELVVGGITYSIGGGGADGIHIVYSLTGNILALTTHWTAVHEAHYSTLPHETGPGNFIVFGNQAADESSPRDLRIDMINSGGGYIWARSFGGSDDEDASQIIRAKDGGFFCVGSTMSYGNGMSDIYVIKTDSLAFSSGVVVLSTDELPERSVPVRVFPNPGQEEFSLYSSELNFSRDVSLIVLDATGRQVDFDFTVSEKKIALILKDPLPGIYFCRVTTKEYNYTVKLFSTR